MQQNRIITIIVPIYKAEQYLYDCLKSIQQQEYPYFEVICVNDGSPDNSSSIVENFVNSDKRFILINQENGGVSKARNTALKRAKGDYVCFVDSDDIISNDYLSTLLFLSKDGSFSVCSYSRTISELGKSISKRIDRYSSTEFIKHIFDETIEHPNICMMLFKNSIIQTQNIDFTIGCTRNEDTEFYVKYLLYEEKVAYINKKCYYYRVNMSSEMHTTTIKSLTGLEASKRIGALLKAHGIYTNENVDLFPSIQSLLYHLGREDNISLYNYLHDHYNVQKVMKSLLVHPSKKRKIVSFVYLCCGKDLFFKLLSAKIARNLPL